MTTSAEAETEAAQATATFTSTDPATGKTVAEFPVCSSADIDAAVATARTAAVWWTGLRPAERERYLLDWAGAIWSRREELADLLHRENGKTLDDCLIETVMALEHLRWAARNAERVLRTRRVNTGLLMVNHSATVQRLPLGVIGVIGPWNYPLYTPMGSIAYALAAGNAVVFKPSEYTPAVGAWLARSFAEAVPSAPDGLLTVVTGDASTGAALCHSGVDKIAFTGSTPTGRAVMAACAQSLTPVVLECGGKDAVVIAEDADLNAAAHAVAWGSMSNGGQTCVGVERAYVVASVRDAFVDRLRAALAGVHSGSDHNASYGPMTTQQQADIVRAHVSDALARGAKAVHGNPQADRGRYVDPLVLLDAPEDSLAVAEETFGPTVTVTTVADVDEAVRLVNASRFGLAGAVFSRRRGQEIASRLDVGVVTVNAVMSFAGIPGVPLGGSRDSGFGRVHGAEGLREFTRTRGITHKRFSTPGMDVMTLRRTRITIALTRRVAGLLNSRTPRDIKGRPSDEA
ncbi:aldehyde dehydrogenase family protein [Streptomyces fulvoviolaceus]|uniref:aldehyde dehydrogenase family protein n=1 Tax=Streptomyces fulvoviolaceus TaxID=285535 RepID=UPI000693466B|nr:aldehyde dehydrogenase family protein [Streptomyces fulvoviolaceus]